MLKSRLGIKGKLVVLYCGRLSAEKNPLGLLSAWPEVYRRVPEAVLYYVGDGPQSSALQAQIALCGLQDSVSLTGYKSDTLDWYRAADLFVLPSHFEGLSNSLLEAISCGLPVVSTRVSGSEELLEKVSMGGLVDIDNAKALTETITKLLLDPNLRSRDGLKAREYALSKLEIDNIATDIVRLYKQLIASEKCPSQ
ncbi:MAG: glycosyltransferase family 4 protein [Syntrophobacteraceae bacterium]